MPTYDATIRALKAGGARSMTVNAAVKSIESWETTLEKVEVSGAKTVVESPESLKKQLTQEAVKVKALGEALNGAAEGHDEKAA